MVKLSEDTKIVLLDIYKTHNIGLEGNILKIIDTDGDSEFESYLNDCKTKDTETRRKRLEITKKVQEQNKELQNAKDEIERINKELLESLDDVQKAKKAVENDLDILQKKNQYEMINNIVNGALFVIIGIGIVTTLLYIFAIVIGKETQIIGSTWSNLLGILLTNAFSIVGTIMGVKYAKDDSQSTSK